MKAYCSTVAAMAVFSLSFLAFGASDLESQIREDLSRPVRPGGVGGQEYWNGQSVMFQYPPSFGFAKVEGAAKYHYVVEDDARKEHSFWAETPNETLARIWPQLPTGFLRLEVRGAKKNGRVLGIAGSRRFWKSAPFSASACPAPAWSYVECARRYYDWLYAMTNTQMLAETGATDECYLYNTYPGKTESALVQAFLRMAELEPARREKLLRAARHAADFLIGFSNPAGTPLEYFPHTYRVLAPEASRQGVTSEKYAGQNMLIYPASAGSAYLALYEAVKDEKYLAAAKRIAETYRRLQGEDGTWYLKLWEKDATPVAPNRLMPLNVCAFLEKLHALTGETTYREMADRAFAYVEKGPLATWNWEAQFEDVEPSRRFRNMSMHPPCDTALYLLKRYPGDAAKTALARECLRFAEDQFVAWEPPFAPDGRGPLCGDTTIYPPTAKDAWYPVPGVFEQYDWYLPIDNSAAKMIRTCLALYRAEGKALDLAKAKALGNAVTHMQKAAGNGAIPTHWVPWDVTNTEKNWINCGIGTARALEELDAAAKAAGTLTLKPGDVEIVVDPAKDADLTEEQLVEQKKAHPVATAFAAEELKNLLGEAFGAKIPVVAKPTGMRKAIHLETDLSMPRDDIRLVTDANGVRIISGEARIYGVYEFLERYAGMRFYFPGPLGTIVPKRASLEVPFGTVRVSPDYTQRSCDMSWGLNGRWYSLKGGEADKPEVTNLCRLARGRMRLAPRLMCCHGLNHFKFLDRFGKTHPEYFALLKDAKGFYRDGPESRWKGHHGQLCHTSGVWEEIYRDTARRLKAGEKSVDVMAQDGMQKCLCEKCLAAYSKDPGDAQYATDLMWGNTVALARRLTAEGIPGCLTQMAYQPYNRIPDIDIPTNVLVMVARTGPWAAANPEKLEKDNAGIRAWAKKLGHKVWIWNYACKTGRKMMKNVDIPQMAPHAVGAYYKSLSDAIFGSYFESRTDRWIYNYLNYYVYNKVCWDTKADVDALLDEHYRLMFGPAADEMKAWFERLEWFWINKVSGNFVQTDLGPAVVEPTPYQKWVDIYTPQVLAEFDGYLSRAAAQVPAGSLEARRIAFFREHYYVPLKAASDAYLDKVDAERNAVRREGRENRSILKGTRFDAPEEIVVDGDTPGYKNYAQNVADVLKPNTKYVVSYFVKFINVVAKVRHGGINVVLYDGKKGPVHPKADERAGSRDWQYQEFEFETSPEIGKAARLRVGVEGASGTAWFKGVRVEEAR